MSKKKKYKHFYEKLLDRCFRITNEDDVAISRIYNNIDALILEIIDKNAAAKSAMDKILLNAFENAHEKEFNYFRKILDHFNLTSKLFDYAHDLVVKKKGGVIKRGRTNMNYLPPSDVGEGFSDDESDGDEDEDNEDEQNVVEMASDHVQAPLVVREPERNFGPPIQTAGPLDAALALVVANNAGVDNPANVDKTALVQILVTATLERERNQHQHQLESQRNQHQHEQKMMQMAIQERDKANQWDLIVSSLDRLTAIGIPFAAAGIIARQIYNLGAGICTIIIEAIVALTDGSLTALIKAFNASYGWWYNMEVSDHVSTFFATILEPLLTNSTMAVALVASLSFIAVFLICHLLIRGSSIKAWTLGFGIEIGDTNRVRNPTTGEPAAQRRRIADQVDEPLTPRSRNRLRLTSGGKKQKRKQTRKRKRSYKNKK